MSLIRNFQEEQAARVLSCETRDTLRQWHRRRTTQRSAPSIDDFQVRTNRRKGNGLISQHTAVIYYDLVFHNNKSFA